MLAQDHSKLRDGIFITFPGNCKKALSFYQSCFGGHLYIQTFEEKIQGYREMPVINGSLVSDRIIIHGSDLVQNEGRKIGNYLSVFLNFDHAAERRTLMEKLNPQCSTILPQDSEEQKLIELTDAFDVRWILGI